MNVCIKMSLLHPTPLQTVGRQIGESTIYILSTNIWTCLTLSRIVSVYVFQQRNRFLVVSVYSSLFLFRVLSTDFS